MSDLLSIGASGVRAYQSALTTVSENIANTGVAGYSRRSIDLKEIGAPGVAGGSTNGSGVAITGVSRSVDAYKTAAVRSAGTDLARTETSIGWLDDIDGALTGNQLASQLTAFFTSARTLAADPSSGTARAAMLGAADTVASAFASTGRALDQVSADLDTTANGAAQSLDSLGAALAKVNDGLGRSNPGTAGAVQLLDQRDRLLEQMSALSDVAVTTDAAGRATVRLGGQSGPVLVAGTESGHVSYARNDEGAVVFAVQRAGTVSVASPSGGVLAGVVDGAQRIADARLGLNGIARDFVTSVNAVQAQGRDLDGASGAALFAVGDSPTDISVALDDPRGIAAASVGGGTRDNGNLAALESVRTVQGFEGKVTTLVAGNATTLAQRKTIADAQGAIRDGAVAARDSASGVNLDSEAVDLLRFQQAYSASSRVIQTARDILQSILDIR